MSSHAASPRGEDGHENVETFTLAGNNEEQSNGGNYGGASSSSSQSVVFVKLTDSALKALEDYYSRKNAIAGSSNKNNSSGGNPASIGFESNVGFLSLPTEDGSCKRFNFSLSNVDADGPQGSYECIRHRNVGGKGHQALRQLENLGKMDYKVQVHASDDSYQKTKAKMASATEESKKHSAKVIKESGPNVGRKVKVKKAGMSSSNAAVSHSSNTGAYSSSNKTVRDREYARAPSPPALRLNGKEISTIVHATNSANRPKAHVSSSGGGNGSSASSPANPDLLRRPLKDRLVHLLALRPYKKPELIAKLNKEGIKEKDKKSLGQLLNSVAAMKENAYHLGRAAWLEVQADDWPYYSPDERDMVRRRNPHLSSSLMNHHLAATSSMNVLSPLSSDCSSLQPSPSPPAPTTVSAIPSSPPHLHSSASSLKRPKLCDPPENNAMPSSKRARVSHAAATSSAQPQPSQPPPTPQSSSLSSHSRSKSPVSSMMAPGAAVGLKTNGYRDLISGWANKPKSPDPPIFGAATQQNTAHSNSSTSLVPHSGGRSSSNTNSDLRAADSSKSSSNPQALPDSNGLNSNSSSLTVHKMSSSLSASSSYATCSNQNGNTTTISMASTANGGSSQQYYHSSKKSGSRTTMDGGKHHSAAARSSGSCHIRESNGLVQRAATTTTSGATSSTWNGQAVSSTSGGGVLGGAGSASSPASSPDSGTGSNDGSLSSSRSYCSSINGDSNGSHSNTTTTSKSGGGMTAPSSNGLPDYKLMYKEITSREQRQKYKQDFLREYEEYRVLQSKINLVAMKFVQYEERLRNSQEGSDEWNAIMEVIIREYEFMKKDSNYAEAKKRALYLHSKLAHIKQHISRRAVNKSIA